MKARFPSGLFACSVSVQASGGQSFKFPKMLSMYLDLYPIASRSKIEALFRTIDDLPFTKLRGCKILKEKDPYDKYPVVTINSIKYRVSRLVLERKLDKRLLPRKHALHNCDHPRCVCEHHLYEGDDKLNADDRAIEKGRYSVSPIFEGRTRLTENNAVTVDFFGNKEEVYKEPKSPIMRFFSNQFVEIIGGKVSGQTGKTTCDIPFRYNVNSKVQIKLTATNSLYYVKISHLK